MNRWTLSPLLLAASLLGACGPGHVPGSRTPEPMYPGVGDLDADGTNDLHDHCPRDPGPPDEGGCDITNRQPDS